VGQNHLSSQGANPTASQKHANILQVNKTGVLFIRECLYIQGFSMHIIKKRPGKTAFIAISQGRFYAW